MPQRILIVEDNAPTRAVLERALSREGFQTTALRDGEKALEHLLSSEPYDLLILDLMLPGMDGVTLCRELRERGGSQSRVPVIMLTARDDETSVVVGLEVGADDYVSKPFSPRELVSRVRAHLRRQRLDTRPDEQSRLFFPGLEIDRLKRKVTVRDEPVELTAKEFEVLSLLASHPGRVYTREQIMSHLWDGKLYGETRAADVYVQQLRSKIESDPKAPHYVLTLRGVGYRFAEPQDEGR